jgi:hypothetical protein
MLDNNVEDIKDGYIHLRGAAHYCTLRGLDMEICAIMGMLHDICTRKLTTQKNKAN